MSALRSILIPFIAATLPLHAATNFLTAGGNIGAFANWSNGKPRVGNDGTIALSGSLGTVNFSEAVAGDVTVIHGAGTITGTPNIYNSGSTVYHWNQTGGTVSATQFMVINHRLIYELSGGEINFATTVGGSRIQAVNSGTFAQSGGTTNGAALAFEANVARTHTLSGGQGLNVGASWSGGTAYRVLTNNTVNVGGAYTAIIHPSFTNPGSLSSGVLSMEGGVFNFLPTWTGSLTQTAWAGTTKWREALTQTGVLYDGTQITTANFGDFFELREGGAKVALPGSVEHPPLDPVLEPDPSGTWPMLSWNSVSGATYQIESSADLSSWDFLTTDAAGGEGSTSILDPEGFTRRRKFYRIAASSNGGSRDGITALNAAGELNLDTAAWLSRNNLVYGSPPFLKSDSIPLGSGKVGAAVWIDPVNGLTAHLNRAEGVPALAGLGTLRISNLASLARARDYHGVLSLRDGIFTQTAGALTVTSFFRWGGEELVIDIAGANPAETVNVELVTSPGGSGHGGAAPAITPFQLIAGADPVDEATGKNCIAIAAADATSGSYPGFRATQFFAATAVGREVVASATGGSSRLTFKPLADGSYRVVIPVRIWTGTPANSATLKTEALAAVAAVPGLSADPLMTLTASQAAAFAANWDNAAMIRLTTGNGTARYIEQMLALDTYLRISASLTPLPAVGGGETRLFSWNPVGLFNRNHWYQNLRPINHANIASGVWRGNLGTWDWLLGWLPALKQHVTDTFPGYEGAGYPEYVDGQPGTAGSFLVSQIWGVANIAPPGTRYYTSRMMSTTLEVVSAILTESDYRQDPAFLDTYWPLVREGMLFHRSLLMSGGLGSDGRYHYLGVNSRENNWDDDDDTPDVAAIRQLLPQVLALATRRNDTALVDKLDDLVGKLPELATETRTHPGTGLPVTAVAWSAVSRSAGHNAENPDLDAIWPANHLTDASDPTLVTLANNTLDTRHFRENYDWHPTAVQAARMGRRDLYKEALLTGISRFMIYPQGITSYNGGSADIQTEFTAVQTLAAHEALVQNHDGLLRLATAWPGDWDAIAWLPVEGGHRVALEVMAGSVQTAVIHLGSTNPDMRIRNPWPAESATVRDLTAATTLYQGSAATITVAAVQGHRLLVERTNRPLAGLTFLPVIDLPAGSANILGTRILGKLDGDTFGFEDPHLFDWTLASTGTGLQNTGSVPAADLTVSGSVVPDVGGTGLSLAAGYLRTALLGTVGSASGATVQLDVKPDVAGSYRRLVDYCVPGSTCEVGFLLDLTPENKLRFICSGQTAISTTAVPVGAWTHVSATYRAGQSVTFTIAGASQTIPVAGSAINFSSQSLHLSIGADLNGGSRFTGAAANVRIDALNTP